MALGETIVLVIIKNMRSRNIISVIDAILNVGVAFVLRFKDILFSQKFKVERLK